MSDIQVGNQYRCSEALTVRVWLAIAAPVTMIGEEVLPAGEAFEVERLDVYGGVCCLPLNYDALHEYFVTQEERDRVNRAYLNRYEGYALLIEADVILNQCQLI